MKKIIFSLSLLAAIASAMSCSKIDSNDSRTESFSKAEIKVEIVPDKEGDTSFWNYLSLNVDYWDFAENNNPGGPWTQPGTKKSVTVNGSNPSFTLTCTSKPEDGKDYVADLVFSPNLIDDLPEKVSTNFTILVRGLIYDKSGKVINDLKIYSNGISGEADSDILRGIIKDILFKKRLSLCYVETLSGWIYNFGVEPLTID